MKRAFKSIRFAYHGTRSRFGKAFGMIFSGIMLLAIQYITAQDISQISEFEKCCGLGHRKAAESILSTNRSHYDSDPEMVCSIEDTHSEESPVGSSKVTSIMFYMIIK